MIHVEDPTNTDQSLAEAQQLPPIVHSIDGAELCKLPQVLAVYNQLVPIPLGELPLVQYNPEFEIRQFMETKPQCETRHRVVFAGS